MLSLGKGSWMFKENKLLLMKMAIDFPSEPKVAINLELFDVEVLLALT
jgi:hypothetical protein